MPNTYRLVLLLGLVTAVFAASLQLAAQQESPPRPSRNIEELPRLPGAESGQEKQSDPLSVTPIPWSKLVFQSYRDGNWEIYIGNVTGPYNDTRLTTHGAVDMHPRLNRGATRIAFASKRDGSYEIYTMNVDGSALTRLTFTGSDNVNPFWSPDGRKIAFQSYRDGQSEIYVMNADGSGQTRLTADPGYDGYPAWSPDGTKIAFNSSRSGQLYIYVMNTDGSGVTQLSNQIYSYNPSWSPDGTKIAYDADVENDGWQELWVMDANGANQHVLYDPPAQTDAWAHSWSPDGRYITFTYINFVYYQGNWYWENAFLRGYDTTQSTIQALTYDGLDWNPDWQTTDITPPRSAVTPLPKFTQSSQFQVEWDGSDENSGLASYDVQYRIGDGVWQNWQTMVSSTTASYAATPGTTVYFRSRARDLASNVEAWPTGPYTGTTFYRWALWGKITDNRNQPLPNVLPTISPTALTNEATNSLGAFRSLLQANGAHTLDVARAGYGDVAATTLNQKFVSQIYLPPNNDQILNGSFEAIPGLSQWQSSGAVTAVTTPNSHTGNQAAALGSLDCTYPCLSTEEDTPLDVIAGADMVADSLGNLHILSQISGDIIYAFRSVTGTWTTQTIYTGYTDMGLIATPDDQIQMLLFDGLDVQYASKPLTGTWTSLQTVVTLPEMYLFSELSLQQIAVDRLGQLHALVRRDYNGLSKAYYLQQHPGNIWSYFELPHYNLVMDLGPDDTAHFAWTTKTYYPEKPTTYYQNRAADGTWSNIVEVPMFDPYEIELISLAVGSDGTLHILSKINRDSFIWNNYHSMRLPDGTWSSSLINLTNGSYDYARHNMAIDSRGNVHFLLLNYGEAAYRQWKPDTGWQTEVSFATDASFPPLLVVDQYDRLHVLTQGNFNGIYRQSTTAVSNNTAALSQTLTLPADMPAPTLAFMGRRFGDVAGDMSGLELLVTDELTTTAVPLQNGSAAWNHYWADMSPWTGQTVTIQFRLTQTAGEPRVAFWLDDVSLGSAHPNIWLTAENEGAQTATAGKEIVYQLHYGNRGGVLANDTVITATLPTELNFVSASLPVTVTGQTLVWNLGDLTAVSPTQTIFLTTTVAANTPAFTTLTTQVAIDSATSEIEISDNTAQIQTFIGYRSYLPRITR